MAPRAKRQSAAAQPKPKKRRGAFGISNRKAGPRNKKKTKEALCPIVGIGGSAGGFEAAMELLRHLPPRTGMSFVVVQHLDPRHASRLSKLLSKVTPMPVIELAETTTPRPNTVYVQPPNKCVIVKDGALKLIRRTQQLNLSIDHFFESLAEERGSRAIGVILSGTGTDGTHGLQAIKAAGGLTFAQSEASAKFDAMPRSAIRAGFVDAALPPREIAQGIRRIADHPYILRPMTDGESAETKKEIYQEADDLGRIFFSLRKQTGVDFSGYKQATLLRRIHRRMALHRMENLSHYAKFLRDNKQEIETLFDDLLINVTHFFRDERMFRKLKRRFLPALLNSKGKGRQRTLRVWVPGCATGEEVYSLAISVLETLGQRASNTSIQIFGT
jgi:two-component system CheB/CheR fusion protein